MINTNETPSMEYKFDFAFDSVDQFYAVVHLLNRECGKGNWTIQGKVLKHVKALDQGRQSSSYSKRYFNSVYVKRTIVVPEDKKDVEGFMLMTHGIDTTNKRNWHG